MSSPPTVPLDLTVIAPPPRGVPSGPRRRLPALETLVARGEALPQGQGFEEYICSLFGVASPVESDYPVGPLCRLGVSGLRDEGWWFQVDPLHLVVGRDNVIIAAVGPSLVGGEDEAQRIGEEFRRLYEGEGWRLETSHPGHWYLRTPKPLKVRTLRPGELPGRSLADSLPTGPDALALHGLLNELQMLLHLPTAPGGGGRRGPSVNGMWLSGGGVLPSSVSKGEWDGVWSDNYLARGLATATQLELRELPASLDELLESGVGGRQLVVITEEGMERLEEQWARPLLEALRSRRLRRAELWLGPVGHVLLERGSLLRFWRRPRALPTTD